MLFNNAGGPAGAPLDKLTWKDHIDYGVRLLLSSAILGTKYVVEPMKANLRRLHHQRVTAGLRIARATCCTGAESRADPLHPNGGNRAGEHNIRVNSIFREPSPRQFWVVGERQTP